MSYMCDIYAAFDSRTFENMMQDAARTNQKELAEFVSKAERKQYRIGGEDVVVLHRRCDAWQCGAGIEELGEECDLRGGDFINIGEEWDNTYVKLRSEFITLERRIICKPDDAKGPIAIGGLLY